MMIYRIMCMYQWDVYVYVCAHEYVCVCVCVWVCVVLVNLVVCCLMIDWY